MDDLLSKSLAKSTLSSYQNAWKNFDKFSSSINLTVSAQTIPLSEHTIALFVSFLYEKGYKAESIRSQLSAISYSHKLKGVPPPTESFLVKKLIKGAAARSPGGDVRYPVSLSVLSRLVCNVQKIVSCVYDGLLFKAMFSTAFYGFLRCSEFTVGQHNLGYHQIYISPDSSFASITFTSFKHSKPGSEFVIKLSAKPAEQVCPVKILVAYLSVRGTRPGPFFCRPNLHPVSRNEFSDHLKRCLEAVGLSTTHFKGHSFRIGAATHAMLLGKSDSEIQLLGRWNSSAFKKYLRVAGLDSL